MTNFVSKGVFVLESSRVDEQAAGLSDGPPAVGLLKMMGVPHIYRAVDDLSDFEKAGVLFQQMDFDVLLISAHGHPEGIGLASGEFVTWEKFFDAFRTSNHESLVFSSCSTLGSDSLFKAALETDKPPKFIYGYEDSIEWTDAIAATLCILKALSSNQMFEKFAIGPAIYLGLGINVNEAVLHYETKSHYTVQSSSSILKTVLDNYKDKNLEKSFLEELESLRFNGAFAEARHVHKSN